MSALDSLIRLHRWQVDERRRHVADLEGLAAQLTEEHRRLEREDAREQAAAAASPEAAFTYAAYARQLIERRRKLALSQAEVAEQIERSRGLKPGRRQLCPGQQPRRLAESGVALEGLAAPWVGSSPPNDDNLGICQSAPEEATATSQDDTDITPPCQRSWATSR